MMIDGVYFVRIYNDLKNGSKEYITFTEARKKYGMPYLYEKLETAPGYNSKIVVELSETKNEVVYKLRDKDESSRPT